MSTDNIFRAEKDFVYPSSKTIKQDNGEYNFIEDESDNRMRILSDGGLMVEVPPESGVQVNDMGDN
jgi:hypothetical protein